MDVPKIPIQSKILLIKLVGWIRKVLGLPGGGSATNSGTMSSFTLAKYSIDIWKVSHIVLELT